MEKITFFFRKMLQYHLVSLYENDTEFYGSVELVLFLKINTFPVSVTY